MNGRRDPDLLIAAWLQGEAPDRAPERLLTASRDRVRSTNQRRTWWPARRIPQMNGAFKLAIAAVAVAVVAVIGVNLLPRQGGIGGPSPSTTAVPSSTPSPIVNFAGSFAPGTAYAIDAPDRVGTSRMTFTMPAAGWRADDFVFVGKNVPGGGDGFDLYVSPHLVDNVYTGGCHWRGTALVPRVGPTVDDLATALSAQAGPGASPPTAVTVGGHLGKKVELSIPEGLDVTTCDSDGDFPIFGRWYTDVPDSTFGAAPWTYGNGQHNTVYILDVNGTRQVIDTMYLPGTSAADRAELEQVVASIRFEPRASTTSPSP
jgi:hypothetical protein